MSGVLSCQTSLSLRGSAEAPAHQLSSGQSLSQYDPFLHSFSSCSILLQALEDEERELLQELKRMKGVEGKQLTPLTGEHYVQSRGMSYNTILGAMCGNTGEALILVSVGSEFPAGIRVQPRVKSPALAERAV